ncbi:DUF488 domain-containing protein [Sinomonas mesophila]|uniref:DUF488 family protein n=1 Tax=Sinomonas mesophila TaxID=1531955 RepID=UPI001C3759E1
MTAARTLLLTVGHGAATAEDFQRLLRAAEVASIIDVRIGPSSRKHPHFGRGELEAWLPAAGIAYRWERRLGGFRKLPAGSPDVALPPTCVHRTLSPRCRVCLRKQQSTAQPSCAARRCGGGVIVG